VELEPDRYYAAVAGQAELVPLSIRKERAERRVKAMREELGKAVHLIPPKSERDKIVKLVEQKQHQTKREKKAWRPPHQGDR
jgi:hypothetical protein